MPAPTRPRARRSPRRSSTTSSGPARSSRRRPTTPSSRRTPTRRAAPATRRSSSTSRRSSPTYRLTIGLPGGSQAFAIAERLGLDPEIVADARSRLSENQRAFEETLARIRETEGETSEALDRARAAEARAADALRTADEERRRARRERDEAVRAARAEAERLVDTIRDEVRATRQALERETVTAPSLDAAVARAEAQLARLPERRATPSPEPPPAPVARTWQLGERARSRSGGWEGRIAALEKGGRGRRSSRAGCGSASRPTTSTPSGRSRPRSTRTGRSAGTRGSRGRADGQRRQRDRHGSSSNGRGRVASSLDLRGARVDEALEALDRYLDDAALAGLDQVVVIHGLGTGALRDAVRTGPAAIRSSRRSAPANAARAATERRSSSSSEPRAA